MTLTPTHTLADVPALLASLNGDRRVLVLVAVVPAGADTITLRLNDAAPLDGLDAWVLRALRQIYARTRRPTFPQYINLEIGYLDGPELTDRAVRDRLVDLARRGHVTRVSYKRGWLPNP